MFNHAAGINQYHVTVLQGFGVFNTMRISGVFAKQNNAKIGSFECPNCLVGLVDKISDFLSTDPVSEYTSRRFVHLQSHGFGSL